MADKEAKVLSIKSGNISSSKHMFRPLQWHAHFWMTSDEALILRRPFRRERVFRDRSDPLAFPDNYLQEQ